ncbi:MAG: aromatic-ring-hydroxylating dioxygenase subunit beta, partial [Rhodanobacteraceae bacterium]
AGPRSARCGGSVGIGRGPRAWAALQGRKATRRRPIRAQIRACATAAYSPDCPERAFELPIYRRAGDGGNNLADIVEIHTRCRFMLYRNRNEDEQDFFVGKRNDHLRRVDGAWRIARREIFLDQNVLLAKNLPAFF